MIAFPGQEASQGGEHRGRPVRLFCILHTHGFGDPAELFAPLRPLQWGSIESTRLSSRACISERMLSSSKRRHQSFLGDRRLTLQEYLSNENPTCLMILTLLAPKSVVLVAAKSHDGSCRSTHQNCMHVQISMNTLP